MNRKKTGMLLLVLLMSLVIAMCMTACGGSDADSDASGGDQEQAASSADFDVSIADYSFSDDKTKMTLNLAFNNSTDDSIVPASVISVTATQDGAELTLPDGSLDGPAFGGTETKYELDYDLTSQSPIEFTVTSLDDNQQLLSQEITVE